MIVSKQIQNIIVLIVLILLVFLLRGWWKDKLIIALGGYTTQTTKVVTKTEYIKGKVDTLEVFNHYVKTRGIILNPKPKIIIKYLPSTEDGGEVVPVEYKEFAVDISDTLITGTATVVNDFEGNLKDLELNYKPLFPKFITRVDTVKVIETKTITLSNERAKIGVGVGYNNLNHASILAGYTTKNGWQFLGEYGKNVRNVQIPETIDYNSIKGFVSPNEDLFSIKIIKNF